LVAPGPADAVETTSRPRSRVVRIAGAPLPYDGTYHLLTRFDKLRTVLRTEKPDVLEAHSPYLAAAGALLLGKRAARVTTTFWHSDHIAAYAEPAVARVLGRRAADATGAALWRVVRRLLSPFDATFAAGRGQADTLRAAGVSPVFHVPFGADVATFHPDAASPERRRSLLGGSTAGSALLVGAGRFAIEKRFDVVLDAFERVRARRDAVLVLFGDGPERSRLEARAPAGVVFAGFEADRGRLASALASADVLVHACPCETYGLGIVEAVACGIPVVVPDQGGAVESADPASAAVYRSLDPEACAAAIERLLDRAPLDRRARGREAADRVPTAEQHIRAVLAVYSDLLRR
jgi:alpha-1,6-mannosyltransferase